MDSDHAPTVAASWPSNNIARLKKLSTYRVLYNNARDATLLRYQAENVAPTAVKKSLIPFCTSKPLLEFLEPIQAVKHPVEDVWCVVKWHPSLRDVNLRRSLEEIALKWSSVVKVPKIGMSFRNAGRGIMCVVTNSWRRMGMEVGNHSSDA